MQPPGEARGELKNGRLRGEGASADDVELERQFQAELEATRDLEYANAMKKLQFFLNQNGTFSTFARRA